MNNTETIAQLLLKHLAGSISAEERVILDKWRTASFLNDDLYSRINDEQLLSQDIEELNPAYINNSEEKVWKKIEDKTRNTVIVHRVHFLKTTWFRYAAAVILLFGVGAYLWNTQNNAHNITQSQPVPSKNDIMPGSDKAILTLSDGRQVALNDSLIENIADGGISIKKSNGIITYNTTPGAQATTIGYNSMSTPRGGQYQLVLPDGSKVWLNSASSIKYPTLFTGKNRLVELSGEAYFDIKENKKLPFIVKTQRADVLVLGTEFNINSYSDEPQFSTTLVNGSVKVIAPKSTKIINPGQQAQLSNSQPDFLVINNNVDINQVIAWQKGIFEFKGVSLDVIARQLSRWYNVDVKTEIADNRKFKLSGGITKKTPLKALLKMLEINGVKYKWENDFILLYSN